MTLTFHLDQLRDSGQTEIHADKFQEFAQLCIESGVDYFPVHHGASRKTVIHLRKAPAKRDYGKELKSLYCDMMEVAYGINPSSGVGEPA